ncbi:MAG TPA: XRE family transcriptional regulator [Chromatiaceae bacterium]|nr:XRE family transcriptional regulator [Chromatiaceae bacterium]
MAQTDRLVATLKRALKANGKTYADIAHHLDLSEASVKRLFSRKSFSLRRLDRICQMIGLEISDLVHLLEADAERLSSLTLEQEREIVADLELLLTAVCVLNRWTFQEILGTFDFDEHRLIRLLVQLDRLKMIELLPGNRVKLLVAANFKWLENGPIQQFFLHKLQSDFFASRFDAEGEGLTVINGMLSASSNAVFQRKLQLLAREFDTLSASDAALPFKERNGITVVLATRRWRFGLFQHLRKTASATPRKPAR